MTALQSRIETAALATDVDTGVEDQAWERMMDEIEQQEECERWSGME